MNQSTQRIIRNRIGLLNLAEELGNVSKACRMMGVSRDTFYRYPTARDEGGVEALLEKSRRKPNPNNRVQPQIEQAALEFSMAYPAHGPVRVSNELRKQGVFVSPSGVRRIWLRRTLHSRKLRYPLYLAVNDIEPTKTKAYSPQTNGICERFHRTVKEEFYEIAFRKKVYSEFEDLPADLNVWVDVYNNERSHQGTMCCGRTPMQTQQDGCELWEMKVGSWN